MELRFRYLGAVGRFDPSPSSPLLKMLQLCVALPSDQSENLSVPQSSKVEDLQNLAEESFG